MNNDRFIKTSYFAIQTLFIKLFNIHNLVRIIRTDNQLIIQIIKIIKIKIVMINN